MTPDWFATFAILAWPIAAIVLYREKSFAEATLWTVLGAHVLLPSNVAIKIEMVPAFDKNSIPNLCILIGCIAMASRRSTVRAGYGIVEALAIACLIGPLLTSLKNGDTLVFGNRVLPGVGLYEGISALLSQLLLLCLPFFLGRRFLQRASDTEAIVRVLVFAGLLYSLPMLFEIKMSPVLSNWIYGYFPSGISSEMRYGGFRPVVFMKNGLSAAFFMATTFLAATAFWRARARIRLLPSAVIPAYLGLVVILCKSAGALAYTIVGGIVVCFMTPKVQMRLAVIVVSIGLFYPLMRMSDYFPSDTIVDAADLFGPDRAASLKTRLDQEELLLERASQRFLLGWGRFGRNRVYHEESGGDLSITDGAWIQILGQFGIIGFVSQFGLLALPVFRALSSLKFIKEKRDKAFLAVLALIVALNLFEQIPNSSMSSWNWLLAGALLGQAERLRAAKGKLVDRRTREASDANVGTIEVDVSAVVPHGPLRVLSSSRDPVSGPRPC